MEAIQSIRPGVAWEVQNLARPSNASDLDVRRALGRIGVRTNAEEFAFYRSGHPALRAQATCAARVADIQARAVGHHVEGIDREVSFLVAKDDDSRVLAVAVAYAFGGPFKAQTTIVVEPASKTSVFL